MARTVKFTFASLLEPAEAETPPPALSETEIAARCAEAFAAGHEAGRREAEASREQAVAHSLTRLGAEMQSLFDEIAVLRARAERDAVRIAVAVARKLSAALIAREPLANIEALVIDCLRAQQQEPRLVVRVAPPLLDPLRAHIDRLSAQSGFAGRVILLDDPDLGLGDCRIEWPDGGTEHRLAEIDAAIALAVARYLDVAAPAAPPAPSAR